MNKNRDEQILNVLLVIAILGYFGELFTEYLPTFLKKVFPIIIFFLFLIRYRLGNKNVEVKNEEKTIKDIANPLSSNIYKWKKIERLKKEKDNFDDKDNRNLVRKILEEIDNHWFPITKNPSSSYRGKTINKLDQIKSYFTKPCLEEFKSYLLDEKNLKDIANRLRDFNFHNDLDYKVTQLDKIVKIIEKGMVDYPEIEQNRIIKKYTPIAQLTILGTENYGSWYNKNYDNTNSLYKGMKQIFEFTNDKKIFKKEITLKYNFSDEALKVTNIIPHYINENKSYHFPFHSFGKAVILYKKNDNLEWIECAKRAKIILEETTKIPNCKKDHFAVLEVINKMLEDTDYLLPNELIFNIS